MIVAELLVIFGLGFVCAVYEHRQLNRPPPPPPPKPPPPIEPDWVALSKWLPYRVPIGREEYHVKNSIYSPYRK